MNNEQVTERNVIPVIYGYPEDTCNAKKYKYEQAILRKARAYTSNHKYVMHRLMTRLDKMNDWQELKKLSERKPVQMLVSIIGYKFLVSNMIIHPLERRKDYSDKMKSFAESNKKD